MAQRHGPEFFRPYHARQILDFVTEGQRRLIDLCICQCDFGISRSAGVAAALSYILTQDDAWVFENPRYIPNRLVYRTILNVYYRDNPHPPYHPLEKDQGYTYLGSIIDGKDKFDLYLYRCAGEEPMLAVRYGNDWSDMILGFPDDSRPAFWEARRRVDLKGLLNPALF